MTLREILNRLDRAFVRGADNEICDALNELENRVEFIEQLIEDGLYLENEFLISCIWRGK